MKAALVCASFVAGLLGCVSEGSAQSSGAFTTTGAMNVPRVGHTATLLLDGRVLIAGGASHSEPVTSAEIYDPALETFTITGSMTTARRFHSATLLLDGRVLIAGGYASNSVVATAELYDPATGTFTPSASLRTGQGAPTSTLLRDGRVLIAGGFTSWPQMANAEIYDPIDARFTTAGDYGGTRYVCDFCSPATLLADGNVLLARSQPAQLFDPISGAFSQSGGPNVVDRATATLLPNGKVLLTGGGSLGRISSTEFFDPVIGAFVPGPDMLDRRLWHSATLLPDGTTLLVGGETDLCDGNFCFFAGSLASAELYNTAETFIPAGRMTTRRAAHTATLLPDGSVLITGGVSYEGIGAFLGTLATAELYRPAALIPAPKLFSVSGSNETQGAIVHAGTDQPASPGNPGAVGEILEIYLAGLTPGSVIPPVVSIGGRSAPILYFGKKPGSTDLHQVNVRVPAGVESGPAVPVRLHYLDRASNEVTIAVRALP
jgi:Kelch motif protein